MQKALSFALIEVKSDGRQVIRVLNLGWTRAVAGRNLQLALTQNLGDIRLAKVELDYLGMGKMENLSIVKVY
jgi:hypothetical protein